MHDRHARERQLKPDDRVYVRNFSNISKQQWLPGIIFKQSGPVSYVRLTDGRVFRRHQDRVRLRYNTNSETGSATGVPGVGQTNEEACLPVTFPGREPHAEVSVPPEEDGHSSIEPRFFSQLSNTRSTQNTLTTSCSCGVRGGSAQVAACMQTSRPPCLYFLTVLKVPVYVQRYASYNTIVMFSVSVECWNSKGEKCCNVSLVWT